MAFITWEEKYSVGIASIDLQHQQLIKLINELHDAMAQGQAIEIILPVINELDDYTKKHFSAEEAFFRATQYPDYLEHKKQHDEFIEKVDEFQEAYSKGKSITLVMGVSRFLWDWLSQHIMVVDKKYVEHLKKHGVV